MEIIKRLAKFRKILGIALIAIPWFFRDQVATTFDINAQELNSVLIARQNQEQDEAQAKQQKEIVFKLAALELQLQHQQLQSQQPSQDDINQDGIDPKEIERQAEALFQNTLKQEGEDLVKSAQNLLNFKEKVNLEPDTAKKIGDSAKWAQDIGVYLQNGNAATEDLFKVWNDAEIALEASYKTILEQAEKDSQSSSGLASTARFIAWLFTAIGALVAGDWRNLISGFMGRDDQQATLEGDGTAPQ